MQKINEIIITRRYKGQSRTVVVSVYAKRRKAIAKALVEKYGLAVKGPEHARA